MVVKNMFSEFVKLGSFPHFIKCEIILDEEQYCVEHHDDG